MRSKRFLVVCACGILLACATISARAATYPQDHNAWWFGLGVGGGSAGVTASNGTSSDRTGGAIGSLRAGYPINEKLSLALESNGWSKSEDGVTVTFNATTAGVALFPSEGFVVRAGIGLGRTTLAASSGGVTVSASKSGFGVNGAAAYEFRLTRTFALGPQLEFGYASFDGGSSDWVGGSVDFNWYFLRAK